MKISKSKQELARIISENGGWIGGEFYVMRGDGKVLNSSNKPFYDARHGWCCGGGFGDNRFVSALVAKNWCHTILSRAEYFHLYPAPDADVAIAASFNPCMDGFEVGGVIAQHADSLISESNVAQYTPRITAVTTIEQLAADYRNLLDFAQRKQQEADSAKADADARLKALELAGEAIGLLVSPITTKQEPEPELVIAVQVGDEVECVESNIRREKYNGMVGGLLSIDEGYTSTPYLVDFGGEGKIWCYEVKFIRRP